MATVCVCLCVGFFSSFFCQDFYGFLLSCTRLDFESQGAVEIQGGRQYREGPWIEHINYVGDDALILHVLVHASDAAATRMLGRRRDH